jgi:hypothetical protein
VIAPLTRALFDRARDVARWETGIEPRMTGPRAVAPSGTLSPDTVEFRLTTDGPAPATYIVTVHEVRAL